MNWKQIIILVTALIVASLIVWHALPLEFPYAVLKELTLCVELFIVVALTAVALVLVGGKKKVVMKE